MTCIPLVTFLAGITSLIAGADGVDVENAFLNYGFAGVLLGILFWFLRALVTLGVKPFVESTLKNQAALVEAMDAVRLSSERTATLVADLHSEFRGRKSP